MNKNELFELEKVSKLTPNELKEQNPEIYSRIQAKAVDQIEKSLDEQLADVPADVRKLIGRVNLTAVVEGIKDIALMISDSIKDLELSTKEEELTRRKVQEIEESKVLSSPIYPDLPIEEQPLLREDLQAAKLYHLGDIVRISNKKMAEVIRRVSSPSSLTDDTLTDLVDRGYITTDDAKKLGLTTSLYNVLDQDIELVKTLKTTRFKCLGNRQVKALHDLVKFDRNDWLSFVQTSNVTPPVGLSDEDYAAMLANRIAALYPTAAFMARFVPPKSNDIRARLTRLKPIISENRTLFGKNDYLTTKGMSEAQSRSIREDYTYLKKISNSYPGLGIDTLLDDPSLSITEKAKCITERIEVFNRFINQNSGIELFRVNYSPDSAVVSQLDFAGLNAEEQTMVLETCKVHQRMHSIAADAANAKQILEAGYKSATSIAIENFDVFKNTTGLDYVSAEKYYVNSLAKLGAVAVYSATIFDIIHGGFDWTSVGNTQKDINEFLKKMKGFSDFFGNQSYCSCQHCQSIISPAAYFVDLMKFVEDKVLDPNLPYFNGKEDHPLHLKNRRPDLWDLELTCANTLDEIPSLDIINEILEDYIANELGGYAPPELEGHDIAEYVVYTHLSRSLNSFNQPFNLPLVKLIIYLSHFERTREEITRTLGEKKDVIARAVLNVSKMEYDSIITSKTDLNILSTLYNNIDFELLPGPGFIKPIDVQLLLKAMGITRDELDELCQTLPYPVIIQSEKIDPDNSIQNDIENIYNLTPQLLDYMHRFVRLWRHLPGSMGELHLVLSSLDDPKLENIETVEKLPDVLLLQKTLRLSLEEACGLWNTIPKEKGVNKKSDPFFDQLFNPPSMRLLKKPFPELMKFTHPSFIEGIPDEKTMNALHRLRAGLRISDEDLFLLITSLHEPLGLKLEEPNPANNQYGFELNLENLTFLYRHAVFAKYLQLSIPDLFQLIEFAGLPKKYIQNLNDGIAFLELYTWWQSSDYSLDDLGFITHSTVYKKETYPDAEAIQQELIAKINTEKALNFSDTVLAFIQGITEDQSRKIITSNPDIFKKTDTLYYRIAKEFKNNTPINTPPEISQYLIDSNVAESVADVEKKIRDHILNYHASRIIPVYLAGLFNISVKKTEALLKYTQIDLFDQEISLALYQNIPDVKLTEALKVFVPLTILFKDDVFDPEKDPDKDQPALDFIRAYPEIFSNIDYLSISIENIKELTIYTRFAKKSGKDNFSTLDPNFSASDVRQVIQKLYEWVNAPAAEKIPFLDSFTPMLSRVLNVETVLVRTLFLNASLPDKAPALLQSLAERADLARYMGIGGETLALIVSDKYEDLVRASDGVLSGFRIKYPDEKEWKEKIEMFEDQVRSRKRDALTDFLIKSPEFPEFVTRNDIFHHLLIDVELEGCARTSRVVAATMSLQLYIHRILMNLEQAEDGSVHVLPSAIPADEWEWRKHYRVWEANRKVFLFPEHYIEPDLNPNKTPLLEEFESTLLQQEINEQNVLDAYATYLKGFEDISGLHIAGSYHDINKNPTAYSKGDILYLFGVTQQEPPVYYFRTIDNLHWGSLEPDKFGIVWHPWRKIDLQIPVKMIAPIIYNNRLYIFWNTITTSPNTKLKEAELAFLGYKHKIKLYYSQLRLDNTWTAPQEVTLVNPQFPEIDYSVITDDLIDYYEYKQIKADLEEKINDLPPWVRASLINQVDSLINQMIETGDIAEFNTPKYDNRPHLEPIDSYTLKGYEWKQVYPSTHYDRFEITMADFTNWWNSIDFYRNCLKNREFVDEKKISRPNRLLFSSKQNSQIPLNKNIQAGNKILWSYPFSSYNSLAYDARYYMFNPYAYSSLILEETRLEKFKETHKDWSYDLKKTLPELIVKNYTILVPLIKFKNDFEISSINGSVEDCIININGDLVLIQGSVGYSYVIRRLNTTLSNILYQRLISTDFKDFLSIQFQQEKLKEAELPFDLLGDPKSNLSDIIDESNSGTFDLTGPLGVYFNEIFFYIPFFCANYLNSKQDFYAAQQWYHFIFNPTADEETNIPDEDRPWRYIKFRNLGLPKLRDIITDAQALAKYKSDPFNPFAIADLRLSAYQKSIFMKYIDNHLDWGDSLFAEFTMESVNEALLHYIIAADLLGERPADIGDCGEGDISPKTYNEIAPLLKENEFFPEMETYIYGKQNTPNPIIAKETQYAYVYPFWIIQGISYDSKEISTGYEENFRFFLGNDWKKTNTIHWSEAKSGVGKKQNFSPKIGIGELVPISRFGYSTISQLNPVFCIPVNKELLDYWNRVEDRLYKIRNCMDISGIPRKLALFAPEIDPRLLVRLKAAGLSIEDVLNATSGNLPPYRFSYLIEKAKNYASVLQQFGSSLMSALEKKDLEELNRLRTVHEQNLQKLTTQVKKWEIEADKETLLALERKIEGAEYRKAHYKQLIEAGLTSWERVEQITQHTASACYITADVISQQAGILTLLPQIGSPFAMTYGGEQFGGSTGEWAQVFRDTARVAEIISKSAGLEANFNRREEEWKHQVELAEKELKELEKQFKAAEIKKQIAEKSLDIHMRVINQTEEIYDFYADKFSNFGLYTWLSTQLQRFYREAYNSAYSMARLAAKGFEFERGIDQSVGLKSGYWDASKSGLLAGEALLIDLQNLERRYIETNFRDMEIDQSFSLAQIDPAALIELREEGECNFKIPEIIFDLFYPGQYRRKIKAVRVTIPCVTGPYTNVSATLTLLESQIRNEPKSDDGYLVDVPLTQSVSIATSKAQNDGGVFEFNFRDERYMPFEGAGVVSTWKLTLPKNFRNFDYRTISDVILHINYTAEMNEVLQVKIEGTLGKLESTILNRISDPKTPLCHAFSLRYDFANEFYQLLEAPVDSAVTNEIASRYFPYFIQGLILKKNIKIQKAHLILSVKEDQDVTGFSISINGVPFENIERDPTLFGNLPSIDVKTAFSNGLPVPMKITYKIKNPGSLAPIASSSSIINTIDTTKLLDITLYIEYTIEKENNP